MLRQRDADGARIDGVLEDRNTTDVGQEACDPAELNASAQRNIEFIEEVREVVEPYLGKIGAVVVIVEVYRPQVRIDDGGLLRGRPEVQRGAVAAAGVAALRPVSLDQ